MDRAATDYLQYDMITFPLTTPRFHSKVLSRLSSVFAELSSNDEDITRSRNASPLVIEPLTPADTHLTPDDSINSIIGITSPWIDLSSPDPIIADVSRQVLRLELAYAAFCGVSYVVVSGPKTNNVSDIDAYGRAILDGLSQGPYMQIYIWTDACTHRPEHSTEQIGNLANFARRDDVYDLDASGKDNDPFQTWQAWDQVRSICRYSTRLFVALALQHDLPPAAVLSRWYSEPVRILSLNGTTFRDNAKGYPSLPSEHQQYILCLAKLKTTPWLVLSDATPLKGTVIEPGNAQNGDYPTLGEAKHMSSQNDPHILYMRNLQKKQKPLTPMDQFGAGYQDYLQAPLQPLTVNLESITYEVFEKDPIKYEWYERAIARALHDWVEQGKPTSNPDGRVVVAVVGAGRGPLVSRALKAAQDVGVEIDMWALEKNPNAFVLLQRHNETKWDQQVSLVKSDMRTWLGPQTDKNPSSVRKTYNVDPDEIENSSDVAKPQTLEVNTHNIESSYRFPQAYRYKIDILISELLGSFADNELSPECLDGVQHLLNSTHGISIPASYTAHFTPIAAPKLHADISLSMINVNPTAAEIPYVVMLDAIDFLSTTTSQEALASMKHSPMNLKSFASLFPNSTTGGQSSASTLSTKEPQPRPIILTAWSFHHPNSTIPSALSTSTTPTNSHNARYVKFSFPIPHQGTCHGLAGYFETVLYPGVELSTNPLTMDQKSEGMISWFPIFFPFKNPVFLPRNGVVDVSMWRQTDDRKVWYEWMAEVYAVISGADGRTIRVKAGSTDLHSSEKEACLM